MLNVGLDIPVESGIYRVTEFHGISENSPTPILLHENVKLEYLFFLIRSVSKIYSSLLVPLFAISKILANIPFYAPTGHMNSPNQLNFPVSQTFICIRSPRQLECSAEPYFTCRH